MSILSTLKEVVFAETGDPGKVCQIMWRSKTSGVATLLVPQAAYDRFSSRACLRALKVKVPNASKIENIRSAHGEVKYPTTTYHLVRVDFNTK